MPGEKNTTKFRLLRGQINTTSHHHLRTEYCLRDTLDTSRSTKKIKVVNLGKENHGHSLYSGSFSQLCLNMELRTPSRVCLILKGGDWLSFATDTRVGLIHSTAYKDQAQNPCRYASLDWVPACKPKCWWFDVWLGPGLQHAWVAGQVPNWGRARGNRSMYLSHTDVSFPSSLPLFPHSKKINTTFKKKKKIPAHRE